MKDRNFVKFCGITRVEDAMNAQKAGCDCIGFVFVNTSKRYIAPSCCNTILQSVSPMLTTVALFANNSEDEIKEVLRVCDVHVLQFHGQESEEFCRKWNRPYWKAVPMADGIDPVEYANSYKSAQAFLLDNFSIDSTGGSGTRFDWTKIPSNKEINWILAGGLNVKNIKQAKTITGLNNFDVSSGIESEAGIKSYQLMNEFINKLND